MIGTADRETAHLLGVDLSAVTAECRCVVIDREDVAIYVAEIVYPSDCIKLFIDLLGKSRHKPKTPPAAAAKVKEKAPNKGKEKRPSHTIGRT